MKHLFEINDLQKDVIKVYSIEAETEVEAKQYFVEKLSPYVKISYNAFADCVANDTDTIISYLGDTSRIINL